MGILMGILMSVYQHIQKTSENLGHRVIILIMVQKLSIFAVFLLIILLGSTGFSDEIGGVENVFSYGAGLRAIGMGSAFTAMSKDANMAYWNPGAMPFNQYREISLFGQRTIANSYYFSGFYTNPTLSLGTLSIGGIGVYTGGIESYDENASPITNVSSSYLHYQLLISYGYNFRWGMGIGATVKVEQMRITEYKGTGASFDAGIYYSPPKLHWLALGLVVQDIYGTGIRIADEYEENTRIYKAGIATNFLLGKNRTTRFSIAMDTRFYNDNYNPEPGAFLYDISIGSELAFGEWLMFRAGYAHFTFDSLFQNLPLGFSAGMTVRQWGFGIDYAVNFEDNYWQGTPELLMRLGLSYRFGKSMDEKRKKQAEELRAKIDAGIREATAKYDEQLAQLSLQYEMEKKRIEAEKEAEYLEKVAKIDETIENTRQKIIADLTAKFEEDRRKAVESLTSEYNRQRAALETQLKQERSTYEKSIQNLQQQFEREKVTLKEKVVADEAFKSDRYARGLQLYADKKYEEALLAFEEVARVDPNYLKVQEYLQLTRAEMKDVTTYSPEILALYYRGIDLFVQRKYSEAIAEWKKILAIDPYNKLALKNIKEAEDRLRKLKELGISE
jgi:tetratricopeptide (TPR) repeat protein